MTVREWFRAMRGRDVEELLALAAQGRWPEIDRPDPPWTWTIFDTMFVAHRATRWSYGRPDQVWDRVFTQPEFIELVMEDLRRRAAWPAPSERWTTEFHVPTRTFREERFRKEYLGEWAVERPCPTCLEKDRLIEQLRSELAAARRNAPRHPRWDW